MTMRGMFGGFFRNPDDDVIDELKTALAGACSCSVGACLHFKIRQLFGTDGPVYKAGRSEGHADISARLRDALGPDSYPLNLDGRIKRIEEMANKLAYFEVMAQSAAEFAPDASEPIMGALDKLADLRRSGVDTLKTLLLEANRKLDHAESLYLGTFDDNKRLQTLVDSQRQTLTDAFAALNDTKGDLNAKHTEVLEVQKKLEDFEKHLTTFAESLQQRMDTYVGNPSDDAPRIEELRLVMDELRFVREHVMKLKVEVESVGK